MNHEIAESAIDMLIHESAKRPAIHVTFFGGETLMNFPLLRSSVEYAKRKSAEAGKTVEFSLTTKRHSSDGKDSRVSFRASNWRNSQY